MASYDWERVEEGATATASDINERFTAVETEINDLQELSIQPRSLHDAHLPSIVDVKQKISMGASSFDHYNLFVDYADSSGWEVVSDGSSDLEITHSSPINVGSLLSSIQERKRSYIVMANVRVNRISVVPIPSPNYGRFIRVDYYGVFQIQVALSTDGGAATWVSFTLSQRYVNSESPNGYNGTTDSASGKYNIVCLKDMPLRLMITTEDVRDLGYQYIHGARVVCAVWDNDYSSLYTPPERLQMRLQNGHLSTFCLQAPKSNV